MRLRQGIQTNFAGCFLLIPYLKQLQIEERVKILGIRKTSGIPPLNDLLMWTNLAAVGKQRACRVMELRDEGIAIASGLPIKPHQSHLHRFLKEPGFSDVDRFIRSIGKRQYEIGQIDGSIVSLDSHLISYQGQIDIQRDKDGKTGFPRKAIKLHAVHDQGYRNPIYLTVRYPGRKPREIGQELMVATEEIIPDKEITFTMDRWFSVGELLEYIRQRGQKFVTLIRRHKNRIEEMERIPLESFRMLTTEMGVTSIKVHLRNYSQDIRLVVIVNLIDGMRYLYGYLTNDEDTVEEKTTEIYSGRWGIEFWFDEGTFLGIDKLPGIELNEVAMHLATKLVAYDVMSAFRADVGGEYLGHNLATIYEKFFNVQALVKLRGDRIQVTIYGHAREDEIAPMYHNLEEKLKNKGTNSRVPWLNNHSLEFQFK